MALLAATNLQYSIGTRVLLDGVSLNVDEGQRIGLVGRNGCGKTTLLRMLAGRIKPDQGIVNIAKGCRLGYLTQDPELDLTRSVLDEAKSGLSELAKLHEQLEAVYHAMEKPENGDPATLERLMNRQSEIQHDIEARGGYATDHKVEAVLHGLGFTDAQFNLQVGKLSGGQKGRLALAKLLLESPELLLLDEPTNHLDIAGVEWLEEFLNHEFNGAVLMISHDRYMLDHVVERIEELERGRLIDYPGNYTAFVDIRKQRLLTQARAYENQQSEWAKEEEFIRRFKAGQRAKEAQGRLSKLERQKELFALERPTETGAMRFNFPSAPRSGDHVVTVRDASKKYQHPIDEETGQVVDREKILFHDFNVSIQRGERWAVIGPNGAGKTTLVRCILAQLPLDAGTAKVGANVIIGYYQQLPPDEDTELPVYQYLQTIIRRENPGQQCSEQQARDLAGAFLFSGGDQDKQLKVMSGGERSRARLAGLLASTKNLIVLDEPTNHLDIPSAERLELALKGTGDGDGFDGTLILISHDRALIDATCEHLIVLDGHGHAEVFHGKYSEFHAMQLERAKSKPASSPTAKSQNKPTPHTPPAPKTTPKPVAATTSSSTRISSTPAENGSKWADRQTPKPDPKKKTGLSWMPMDRLESEIAKLTRRIKDLDTDMAREEVYRDQTKCQKILAERDETQVELERHEEEWLSRGE